VAKKAKKRVRREYTKAEEKELRAHSKARTASQENRQTHQAQRSRSARESSEPGYRPRTSAANKPTRRAILLLLGRAASYRLAHLEPLELGVIQVQRACCPLPDYAQHGKPLIWSMLQTRHGFSKPCEKHRACDPQPLGL